MSRMPRMFYKDLICINPVVKDSYDVIDILSNLLLRRGVVEPTYREAVISREKEFPTGLLLEGGNNIAIPHTDRVHVRSSAVAIGILDRQIEFMQMGSNGERVQVNLVFLLAIKDPKQIITFLRSLVSAMQSIDLRSRLLNANNTKQVMKMMGDAIGV